MPIFTAIATTALAAAGITSTFIEDDEIVEVTEERDDEGDDE